MENLDQQFEQAVNQAQTLPRRPSNAVLLEMYGLYKQATEGDVQGSRPKGFDFKAIAKYDAWAERKGMTTEDAKAGYVQLVNQLLT
jgi:acyl-CoA-binding protein